MSLNWLARPSSSSPVLMAMRWAKSPLPMRSAPARKAWIGPTMRRARKIPASTANIEAASSTTASRCSVLLFCDRRLFGECGLHLHELRHVGVAQHEADIGMRDQPALRTHDIGVAVFADLDLRHHVPNQLEIDLSDADAGVLAGAGE